MASVFTKDLPIGATPDQIAQHIRYMQEQIEYRYKQIIDEIASIKKRLDALEG